jgi:hypothetical protein
MSPKNHLCIARVILLALIIVGGTTVVFGQKTIGNIDQMTGWSSCDRCAGIGAKGPRANEWMTHTSSPSMDGKSAMFNISSGTPYADALWWRELGPNDGASHFIYDVYFYIKNPGASEALEFDMNQTAGGRRYVYGTQCGVNYDHQWDVWDTAVGTWRKTGIGCSVKAYAWNHLTWEYYRSGGKIHFVAVTLNGRKSYVNRTYGSRSRSGPEINVAFQMDLTGSHTTYQVWLDKFTLKEY